MSYAKYVRGKNALWVDHLNCYAYGGSFVISESTLVDHGDCYEVTGVTIYAPYEYSTEKEAKTKMGEIAESEEVEGVVKNANGSYSIRTMYDLPLIAAYKRESGAWLYCAIASVDEDGYVTDLRRSEWD